MPLFIDLLPLIVLLLVVFALLRLFAFLRRDRRPVLLIDGSNVMHWCDGTPSLTPLQEVLRVVAAAGFRPGVIFDANAGYKLGGGYRDDAAMARLLRLPEAQVLVVPKGEPADRTLLAAARDMGARIVTNDRYRDWAESHPEIATPGQLIRGGWREGAVWLDMPPG